MREKKPFHFLQKSPMGEKCLRLFDLKTACVRSSFIDSVGSEEGPDRVVGHSLTGTLPSGPQVWKLPNLAGSVTKEFTCSNPISYGINENFAIGNTAVSQVFELHPDLGSLNNSKQPASVGQLVENAATCLARSRMGGVVAGIRLRMKL
jgi:hypothetical protein